MADYDNRYAQTAPGMSAGTAATVDEGLRTYMLRVYNYMAGGVALTGLVAYAIFALAVTNDPSLAVAKLRNGVMLTEFGQTMFISPLRWVFVLAPLAFVFFLSFRVYAMSVGAAQIAFWLFAATMGASLSTLGLVYTHSSIARVFFISAAAFAALSLYGYTTKIKDNYYAVMNDAAMTAKAAIMGALNLYLDLINMFTSLLSLFGNRE